MRVWNLLFFLLLSVPGLAQADDIDRAQDLSRRAATAFKAARYQEALTLFEQANALVPHPNLEINIGRSLEKLGQPERAMMHCRLALQAPDAPARTKAAAKTCVDRIQPLMEDPVWRISTTPDGAELRVDGRLVGRTPWEGPVSPGRRQLDAVKAGFAPVNRSIIVERGQRGEAALVLSPAKVGGVIALDSMPPGATVVLDGEFVGTTPIAGFVVPAGRHDAELKFTGYEPQRLTLAVGDGALVQRTVTLLTTEARIRLNHRPQWPAWTMMGAGLATIGVGAVFGVQAVGHRGDADRLARTSTAPADRPRYDTLVSEMEVERTTADVLVTVGGAVVVGGLVWLLWPED